MAHDEARAGDSPGSATATVTAGRQMTCVVVEDQVMFLDLLTGLLAAHPRLRIAARVCDVSTGVAACSRWKPDLLLLDLALADGDGLDVARAYLGHRPDGRVIVLSGHASDFVCPAWLNEGLQAVISKNATFDVLRRELDDLLGVIPAAATARDVADDLGERLLSGREATIFTLIGEGLSSAEIATRLGLSHHTVHTHRKRIAAKLGTRGDELVRRAVTHRTTLTPPMPR